MFLGIHGDVQFNQVYMRFCVMALHTEAEVPELVTPPPCNPPSPPYLAEKAYKMMGAKGAKETFYEAPKLI